MAKRATLKADLAQMEESGQTQLSRTDADARLLTKNGQVVAGYNVQIAVDGKHKLIAASEVVNDGNDSGQLYAMAEAAKEERGVETLTALADTGYYSSATLKDCEDNGIVAYVPQAKRTARLEAQDRISHEAFAYDTEANVYRCPSGRLLSPADGRKTNGSRIEIRYVSRKSDCSVRCAHAVSLPRRRRAPSTAGSMRRCWNGIVRGCRMPTPRCAAGPSSSNIPSAPSNAGQATATSSSAVSTRFAANGA
jgi:hypothetical protein